MGLSRMSIGCAALTRYTARMSGKGLIWMGMFAGGFVGGLLPALWGGGLLAYTLWSSIGAAAGIYGAFKLGKATGAF